MNGRPFARLALLIVALAQAIPAAALSFKVGRFSIGGEGGHDYIVAEPGTVLVFVSRETHFMVVDGATGRVLGDIPDTPGVHGLALAPKWGHGFTTNGGDSTVTMFDTSTLCPIMVVACSDWSDPRFSPPEQAALRFAELFAGDYFSLGDEVYAHLREHFSEEQIVELHLFSGLMLAGGRMTYVLKGYEETDSGEAAA